MDIGGLVNTNVEPIQIEPTGLSTKWMSVADLEPAKTIMLAKPPAFSSWRPITAILVGLGLCFGTSSASADVTAAAGSDVEVSITGTTTFDGAGPSRLEKIQVPTDTVPIIFGNAKILTGESHRIALAGDSGTPGLDQLRHRQGSLRFHRQWRGSGDAEGAEEKGRALWLDGLTHHQQFEQFRISLHALSQ